jgi:UDP-N-acetylglucosamine 4,6-dehydratase
MTKGAAERLWCRSNVYAAGGPTHLAATRYGNVVGSRGSVVDLWRRQKAAGEPLTVTSETATRFWMSIGQAVDLVLAALREMRGGEVFVPRIGSSTVLALAQAIAEPPVYQPGHRVTGLLPGEKEHETLVTEQEGRHTYDGGHYYVIEPELRSWGELPPLDLPRVDDSFRYRSDTNEAQLTVAQLRELMA